MGKGHFIAKIYYLFDRDGDLVDEFTGLSAAKAAGNEGGGHIESWKKQVLEFDDLGTPVRAEYYGGSGNRYTIRDFMPVNFPEGRWSRRYRIRRYGRA